MKRTPITACLLAVAFACHADAPAGTSGDADINAAKGAIQSLAAALKAELGSAMQSGGPATAIEVCNTQAMPITRKIADEHGLEIGRVSLKHRNPANAPNAWQAQVLEAFERRHADGADLATLSWSETVQAEGGREFRYMKPIPTAGVCLTCHGAELPGVVRQVLAERYPDDRATGFAVGDIRGAFVVTRKVSD
jgi:hypothetical protein